MRKSFYIIVFSMIWISSSFALTRVDVQIIEARENIQYIGQKITTNYFLLYQQPNDIYLKNNFITSIQEFEKNIQIIANTTKNISTHFILGFYKHELNKMKKLAQANPTKETAKELLIASEAFIEGVISIASQHKYESSTEEAMLIRCKDLIYLIESVSKYYMAFQIMLKDEKYNIKMKTSIYQINKELKILSNYHYNDALKKKLKKIKSIWQHNQIYFDNLQEISYKNLLLASNTYLKTLLIDLESHHKKNL